MLAAWARRNSRQPGPDLRGAGPSRARASSRRTVDGDTRKPSLPSSPLMRRWPQRGFSRASRSTGTRTSVGMGGRPRRPGGCRHFRRTSARCQPNNVRGVTRRAPREERGRWHAAERHVEKREGHRADPPNPARARRDTSIGALHPGCLATLVEVVALLLVCEPQYPATAQPPGKRRAAPPGRSCAVAVRAGGQRVADAAAAPHPPARRGCRPRCRRPRLRASRGRPARSRTDTPGAC